MANVPQSDAWIYDKLLRLISLALPADLHEVNTLDVTTLHRLLAIARVHGVLGIVLDRCDAMPKNHPDTWSLARRAWQGAMIHSLRIRHHAKCVVENLTAVGIPSILFKGIDFADHLYANSRVRSTFDVDVLVPRERWVDAACLLEATGHKRKQDQPPLVMSSGITGEHAWLHPGMARIEVDLQWNLIHIPYFRGQASLDFCDLDWSWPAEASAPAEVSPATRLVMAVIHAVYHHEFDRLILLADIQRAARALTQSDERRVWALTQRSGTYVALTLALEVAARFLEDPAIGQMHARILETNGRATAVKIPEAILDDARSNLSRIRTHFGTPGRRRIREWLLKQPGRPKPGWEISNVPRFT